MWPVDRGLWIPQRFTGGRTDRASQATSHNPQAVNYIQDPMSTHAELAKIGVQDFAQRFRQEMIPLSNTLAYFAALPMGEDETKEYLEEPIAALPPAVLAAFSKAFVFLVPFLEKPAGKGVEVVTFERPEEKSQVWSAQFMSGPEAILVFGIKDRLVADYHYSFYRAIATLLADRSDSEVVDQYPELLREEFRDHVHGEIDEEGWQLKQTVMQRKANLGRRESKLFRSYVRQSLIDTLTLYLHGICCDIDVETGPRQLPSRYLRKRLQLLYEALPPPAGYAVFPEDLNKS